MRFPCGSRPPQRRNHAFPEGPSRGPHRSVLRVRPGGRIFGASGPRDPKPARRCWRGHRLRREAFRATEPVGSKRRVSLCCLNDNARLGYPRFLLRKGRWQPRQCIESKLVRQHLRLLLQQVLPAAVNREDVDPYRRADGVHSSKLLDNTAQIYPRTYEPSMHPWKIEPAPATVASLWLASCKRAKLFRACARVAWEAMETSIAKSF